MGGVQKRDSFLRAHEDFGKIASAVGEVDDYVLQEFLTDAAGTGIIAGDFSPSRPVAEGAPETFPTDADFGPEFMAAMNAGPSFPAFDPMRGTSASVDPPAMPLGGFVPGSSAPRAGGDAAAAAARRRSSTSKSRRASRASDSGADESVDAETRRKRQREANLQAQRRCRERNRNRVTNLEQEVEELRAKLEEAAEEKTRMQMALQQSLQGLEACQNRWINIDKERSDMREEKDLATQKLTETLEALRNCALQNNMLQSALEARPSEPPGGAPRAALPPPNGSSDDEAVTGVVDDDCKPCAALLEQITAAMDGSLAVKREPGAEARARAETRRGGPMTAMARTIRRLSTNGAEDNTSLPLHEDAAKLIALSENDSGANVDDLKRLAIRLTKQFKTYLVDGNACSSVNIFGNAGGAAAEAPKGPGQTRSVFAKAQLIAKTLDLSDTQRASLVKSWKTHAARLNTLFERRKKLTADALVLQGSSPMATLVDYLSIGNGTLSGVYSKDELLEQGGKMTLTTFAQHACRLQGVIGELRENIGAEQMQNFVLAAEIVGDVLKPLQTCKICANWGPGCPDMLAISRAIVVSTLELMPELGQPELGQPELGAADSA